MTCDFATNNACVKNREVMAKESRWAPNLLQPEIAAARNAGEVSDEGRGCPQIVIPPEARQAERALEMHLQVCPGTREDYSPWPAVTHTAEMPMQQQQASHCELGASRAHGDAQGGKCRYATEATAGG